MSEAMRRAAGYGPPEQEDTNAETEPAQEVDFDAGAGRRSFEPPIDMSAAIRASYYGEFCRTPTGGR